MPARLLFPAVLLVALLGTLLIRRVQATIGDEYANYPQIQSFRAGNWQLQDNLAVPPTYPALVALVARALHVESRDGLRLISLLLSLPVYPLFYLVARTLDPATATLKALQFLFLPILLPYLFILYTDPLALLLFVLALWLALRDQPILAGLAALLDIAVRQNQIVWIALLYVWLYLHEQALQFSWPSIRRHLTRYWSFIVVFLAFAIFVVVNGGVTFGRLETVHPVGKFSLGNVYFALFVCTVLFLPVFAANVPRAIHLVRLMCSGTGWLVVLLVMWVFVMNFVLNSALTLTVNHDMNQLPGFLHNDALLWAADGKVHKLLFLVPILFAGLSLAVLPLREPACVVLYPFWVLAVLPIGLIEHRYYLSGVTLLLLFRVPQNRTVEVVQLGYWMALSLFFLWGIAQAWFFL